MPAVSLLIVDDDVSFVRAAAEIARLAGVRITIAGTLAQARARLREGTFDLALIDLALPDGSGLEVVDLCDIVTTQLVLITGQPTVESALRAFKMPVLDYLIKPLDPQQYRALLDAAVARKAVGPAAASVAHGLVGRSAALRAIVAQVERVGPTDACVLVHGESGVGKDTVARAVHAVSGRGGAFVSIDCGAVAPEALDAALFGLERDGDAAAQPGAFERAAGGTLVLKDIARIPLPLQTRLLQALDDHVIRRIGGDTDVPIDVRIVAACARAPERALQDGALREDFLYRLGEFPIAVPPLRDRIEDVRPLAELFLRRLNERYGTRKMFNAAAIEQLEKYAWPGNVREVRNAINRAFILASGDVIDNPVEQTRITDPLDETPGSITIAVGTTFEDMERRMLMKTLAFFNNDKGKAAQVLGISVKTIYNRLARYQPGTTDDAPVA